MPDRKKLLQDFYAKYAPDQELSDERLKAINTKYGEDNDRLLQDFYTKYAPNEQVTPERLDAIYGKYGLKKKEPTQQAGALGAMPSRSASSGNLQEMLAAAPPLPADARVNVPIGAQPQRPQERAITTALPPIGNIPLRTEEQRTEERRALYEPSQVSKRLSNFAVEMTTVLPAIEQWQTQAGNAMLGRFAGKEANEAERAMMIAQEVNLQDLESKLQEGTEGEIIQSFNKRDIPALAYGIFDASMGILRSGIVGGLTMGAGVIPDMMAQSTRSFNKSKAEALGITPEQLIEQGKEDVAIPTIIGAIGGSLELVGLKGITSAITKKIGTKVGQQIATGLMGTGGEGITEWTQAGLERANESLAKGKSVADATNDAVELMFSEDGLEAALKGMTGAGTTIAAGRGIRALTSAKAKIDAGQPITAQEAQDIAVANIESNGAVAAALENMVNLGAINQQQAQVIGAEMEAMSNAAGKVPDAMAASAPQLAPIILEKQNIDARIAELNVEMATKDESFAPLYKMEIRDLEARKTQLNEQIQAVITPQAQQQVTEVGEVASPVAEQAGAVVEGVQEGGVDTRIANSPLAEVVNKRGVITDANGNLVEGDVYVDGERVVLEAGGKIYDTLGSIDELSQMTAEQLPVQVVAPRITATEGGFTYNSDAGVMPQGTRITPQGKGLKAVKRDKNGNVKSVVVKDDAGNTFNLKGEDAQAMAFELMMDEISKGNLDAKIVLNDEAATAINTAGRPATTQAADSGATQADATRQGAATPTTATERGDGGRGSRVEATQETEPQSKAKDIEQQVADFGTQEADVKPVSSVISRVFDTLKQAGLTSAKTVGDWIGIGRGSEKPYSLKINGEDVNVKSVQPEVIAGFYSPLEKVISETKLDKLPAKQWVDKFAKGEEAKFTGLTDWLSQQQGSVSKADIQDYLKNNRVEIVEVLKGVGKVKESDLELTERPIAGGWSVTLKSNGKLIDVVGREEASNLDEAKKVAATRAFSEDTTKFSQYQLEGEKENYKEVLVLLPRKTGKFDILDENGDIYNTVDTKEEADKIVLGYGKLAGRNLSIRENNERLFKSSHYDEPNILVHLRMNTRTAADGSKVLFLEELQSDWGQQGKKGGFQKPENTQAIKELENEKQKVLEGSKSYQLLNSKTEGNLKKEVFDATQQVATNMIDNPYSTEQSRKKRFLEEIERVFNYWSNSLYQTPKMTQNELSDFYDVYIEELKNNSEKDSGYSMAYRIANVENKIKDINEKIFDFSEKQGVPTAPFVTDTNAWTKLGLKAALKEAVAQGVDKIAWTTGEQQNDRYDLSKQVDEIRVVNNGDGTFGIYGVKNSEIIAQDSFVPKGKLPDLIGKDLANKIEEDNIPEREGRVYEGNDLKVGGKGMKGFYGSPAEGNLGIVGNVAKSLFKQEPKTVVLKTKPVLASSGEWYVTVWKDGKFAVNGLDIEPIIFNTKEEAKAYKETNEPKPTSTQYSIDITPELKASVEQGQPLFKDAEAQYHIQSGKNVIEAINNFNKAKNKSRATVALTHEIMHPTVVAIIDGAKDGNNVGAKHTQTIIDEFNKANPKNRITVEQLIEGNDAFKNGSTSEQYRAVQEFIAESWEQYNLEGKQGFSKAFQDVLDQITKAFQAVYKAVSGKELTPELRQMFDEILGKPKGKEAAQEGEVADKPKTPKERLAESRDRKKAAMDVLKKQWNDAKNMGISTDFEQRLKDDKAFFGAIRDIIQSNIEIGALKITDSLNDIADALGIKLSKADKDAVKGVFNKEVLRSLKSAQAEMFETEVVREALGEYIEENKQVLKGAANAQALKLVNEASTEGGFNRALKYIDKLIDSAEFREAVSNATDAVKNAPSKLSGFAQVGGLVKAIANIKVRGIEDVALLKKMAEILTKPTKSAPFELQNLVNEVNDYLTKKADPEGLSTQEDVLKEFKRITTERVKNEEGEIETRPKTLDTARKIKNYAQRIAEIESAMIDVVQDEAVMEDLRAKIEAEKTRINEAAVNLKEEMEESRTANVLFTKTVINTAKAGDMFSDTMYRAAIKPIQQTKGWEKIVDSADYYTSVKYRNAFDAVAAGYLPRYLFRDITIPLTNFGKVEGAIALSEAAKPKIKKAAKEVDTQPKAFNNFSEFVSDAFGLGKPKDKGLLGKGKQLTKKDIVEKMQGKYAQYIDAMYGMENEAVFLDNFLAPTQNAFEAKDNAVQSVMNKFYKDAGISQASMVFDTAKNTKLESFYKVFYHLLQNEATANGKSGNILKEQLDLIKESSVKSSIPDFKLKIIERISNKYPSGVSDKNLTIGEKKMVKAFKDALNTLKPLQEQANIRRGLDFNAVSEYVPHMALDYSFTPRDIRGETLDFEQTDSMLSDAGNVQYKNPKIKSDRGISRVENPAPFVYNPDITTILGVSANQVLTDYYLFPQIYGANRAFTEATKATGSALPDALRTRYGQMIRMQGVGFKGKAFRAVGGVLKAAYANVLARPIRISQEMIGGIFNYKATGKHGKITRLPKDLKDAVMLSKDGSYKAILDLARKDAYTDVVEFEDGLLEKAKSIGKKAFDVGTSPDAINDGTYRRAHMVSAMRDKFKEITGEDINFNKAASDSEYQAQYKDALKEASTYAYNQTYVKYYSKGRLSRPARPLSFKGHYLYDTTSQGDVAVLADRMLFVFGQYAHRMSQLFHQRMRDGVTDNNYGRTVALSSIGGFLMTAVSYQLVKEFRNYAFGDDEEKKKAEFRFKTTMTSPDYYVAQLFSAFWFFAMGQYGSIGRGMAYLAAYEYSRAIKEYKNKFSEESFAKLESSNRAINNAVKDLTFNELPSTDYGFKSSWLAVTLGGASLLAEESSKIINDVSNLALDAANGDVDAQKAIYVAGFLYNATLSQRTGITIPMLKDFKNREKNLTDQQMTPEALKKKLNKDSRYASQIFEDVALKAALEVVNNEKSNEEAFNDAYELIGKALPDMDEEDRDSKLTKQFTKMLMPTYLYTIDKEQNPEVRGLMFREKRDEVLKSLNEAVRVGNDANIDKYEKMQQELEMYYLENLDNERFIEGFSIPDAEGN